MSVQLKFKESVEEDQRREIIDALGRAGFSVRSLFPGQKRSKLAAIFTVTNASDVKAVVAAVAKYNRYIEYVEAAPSRGVK